MDKNNLQKFTRSVVVVENDVSNVQSTDDLFTMRSANNLESDHAARLFLLFSNFNSPKLDNDSQNIIYSFALGFSFVWIQTQITD